MERLSLLSFWTAPFLLLAVSPLLVLRVRAAEDGDKWDFHDVRRKAGSTSEQAVRSKHFSAGANRSAASIAVQHEDDRPHDTNPQGFSVYQRDAGKSNHGGNLVPLRAGKRMPSLRAGKMQSGEGHSGQGVRTDEAGEGHGGRNRPLGFPHASFVSGADPQVQGSGDIFSKAEEGGLCGDESAETTGSTSSGSSTPYSVTLLSETKPAPGSSGKLAEAARRTLPGIRKPDHAAITIEEDDVSPVWDPLGDILKAAEEGMLYRDDSLIDPIGNRENSSPVWDPLGDNLKAAEEGMLYPDDSLIDPIGNPENSSPVWDAHGDILKPAEEGMLYPDDSLIDPIGNPENSSPVWDPLGDILKAAEEGMLYPDDSLLEPIGNPKNSFYLLRGTEEGDDISDDFAEIPFRTRLFVDFPDDSINFVDETTGMSTRAPGARREEASSDVPSDSIHFVDETKVMSTSAPGARREEARSQFPSERRGASHVARHRR